MLNADRKTPNVKLGWRFAFGVPHSASGIVLYKALTLFL